MAIRTASIGGLSVALFAAPSTALEISQVQQDLVRITSPGKQLLSVGFDLSAAAAVAMHIYDGRDWLVREISATQSLSAGRHTLQWDGTDNDGRPVPPGAYVYALSAQSVDGEQVIEYDLTDLTGGDPVRAREIAWRPQQKQISYVLPGVARVNVRIGLKKRGPLLRSLVNWAPRSGGVQNEAWNGFDASGALDLTSHPELEISVMAFTLSDNTILVGDDGAAEELIQDLPWGKTQREKTYTEPKRMFAHQQQSLETRPDHDAILRVVDGDATDGDGVYDVSGVVSVKLDVGNAVRELFLERRFEAVFFVDGVFAFENETGFLPMTWKWDSAGHNPGIHYLTANIRSYEGNIGVATIKVRVQ